ncbi:hypothetical protein BY996DRAFT_8396890 [Phakopsora pachyrhizi]|nr:hypothetical protein BY996DRAFT_8396890 [Phakopsora pachyrhizi]
MSDDNGSTVFTTNSGAQTPVKRQHKINEMNEKIKLIPHQMYANRLQTGNSTLKLSDRSLDLDPDENIADDLFAKTETALPPNWFMAASNEADIPCVKILPCELLDREDVTAMEGWAIEIRHKEPLSRADGFIAFLEPVNDFCSKGTPILPGFRLGELDLAFCICNPKLDNAFLASAKASSQILARTRLGSGVGVLSSLEARSIVADEKCEKKEEEEEGIAVDFEDD